MSEVVKKNQAWAVEIETTAGTYVAPTAATSYVQTLAEGAEMSRSKEVIERNIFTASIGQVAPRTGMFSVSGSLPVEARSKSTQGAAPEYDALMKSAFGSRRQLTAEETTNAGNTTAILKVTSANTKFAVGDIILVKEAGKYHVSPVKAVTTTDVELEIPAATAFSDGVVIAKHTTYIVADSGHPSLSISRYLESAVLQKAVGCKVTTMALEGFATGQLPSFKFGFEGLNFDSSLTAIPHTPSYDSQVPPIILSAKAFMDGVEIDINELALSLENTLGYKTSIAAENGRVSSRATERKITGTLNPYMASDSISNFTKFKNNTAFSIFAYAKIPSVTAGEFSGIVAVYMPNCLITDLGESDSDGIMQDNISFSANRGSGTTPEIYLGII